MMSCKVLKKFLKMTDSSNLWVRYSQALYGKVEKAFKAFICAMHALYLFIISCKNVIRISSPILRQKFDTVDEVFMISLGSSVRLFLLYLPPLHPESYLERTIVGLERKTLLSIMHSIDSLVIDYPPPPHIAREVISI